MGAFRHGCCVTDDPYLRSSGLHHGHGIRADMRPGTATLGDAAGSACHSGRHGRLGHLSRPLPVLDSALRVATMCRALQIWRARCGLFLSRQDRTASQALASGRRLLQACVKASRSPANCDRRIVRTIAVMSRLDIYDRSIRTMSRRRSAVRRTTGVGLEGRAEGLDTSQQPGRLPEASGGAPLSRAVPSEIPFVAAPHRDIGFMTLRRLRPLPPNTGSKRIQVDREQGNPRNSSPHFAAPCGVLGYRARCAAGGTDCLLRFDRVRFPQLAVGARDLALVQVI